MPVYETPLPPSVGGQVPPGTWPRRCIFPLPTNTTLVAVVRVDINHKDFYYRQDRLPGAEQGGLQWVCRLQVAAAGAPSKGIGTTDSPVEQLDLSRFEPSPQFLSGLLKDLSPIGRGRLGMWVLVGLGLVAVIFVVRAIR